MTTLVLNYSTNLLESLYKTLRTFLTSMMIGWQNARQREANYKVATHMLQTGSSDWKGHTVASLTHYLNERMGLNKK